jgi:hypothetical protein
MALNDVFEYLPAEKLKYNENASWSKAMHRELAEEMASFHVTLPVR